METILDREKYLESGVCLNRSGSEMEIDLNQPRKIRIVGHDEASGRQKEYFLKVTERKGLVLV